MSRALVLKVLNNSDNKVEQQDAVATALFGSSGLLLAFFGICRSRGHQLVEFLALSQLYLNLSLLEWAASRFVVYFHRGCSNLLLNSEAVVLQNLRHGYNSRNGHPERRELDVAVLLHIPLGEVDVEEEGLLRVGHLDAVAAGAGADRKSVV